jgi:Carboxypeptidase regulatory-like domain
MIVSAIATLMFLLGQTTLPTASISGRVLRVGTSEPIRNARVEAIPSPGNRAGPVSATTDGEGRFVIHDIDPGTYVLEVSAAGFARQQYGQNAPTGLEGTSGRSFGKVLTLASGQRMEGVAFHLTPAGSISGNLRDRDGQPAAEVGVYLLRLTYSSSGRKTLIATAYAETNDRGDYRLYWITPGRYYVAASVDIDSEVFRGLIGREPVTHLRFFPGVSEIRDADHVDVGAGAELTGINIVVETQKSYAIRGRIVDSRTGKPPAQATLQLITLSFSGGFPTGSRYPYDPSDGSFAIDSVLPGTYLAAVFTSPNGPSARVPITVVDSDIDGLVLKVEPPITIPMKLSADHGDVASIPGLDRWRFSLSAMFGDKSLGDMGRNPAWSVEGASELANMSPGTYRFPTYTPSPDVYFKEVKYGNRDALREAFPISGESVETLTILLGMNPGQIESIVLDAAGQPLTGTPVVLIPEDRGRTDLYKIGNTDAAGRLNFRGLAPGGYKVFAWDSIEPFSWFDPQVMERYESRGAVVRVTESSKESVTVRTIP